MDLETRDQRSSFPDGGSDMKRSASPESLSPPGFASSAGGSSPPSSSTSVSTSANAVRSSSAGAGPGSGTGVGSGGLVVTVPLQHESATGKPAVPVHCVVELSGAACQELGQPTQEAKVITDGYAILPSNTTLNNLVTIALEKLGIYGEVSPAKGALQIKNWKPLGLEQITENPSTATVGEILSDLGQLVTLRITLLSLPSVKNEQPEEPAIACQTVKREEAIALPEETTSTEDLKESPARDLSSKDLMLLNQLLNKQQQQQQQQQQQLQQQLPLQPQQKSRHSTERFANQFLLNAAALQNHMQITEGMTVPFAKGHELFSKATITENGVSESMYQQLLQSFSSTDKRTPCGSGMFSPERRDEILRTFIENAPKLSQGPGAALPAHLVSRKRPSENEVLDFSTTPKLSNNVAPLATTNSGTNGVTKFDEDKLHASKPRVRTTFDPETEVPQLHAWFQKDQHPTRVQIQDYVEQLNAARRALSRDKLLNVNNVVYWFKNARAAYKRRRLQGSNANQLASQSNLDRLASANSPSSMRGDMDTDHEGSVSPPPTNNGGGNGNKLLPVSQAGLSVNALQADDASTPLLDKWKEFEYQRRLAEAQHRWQHIAAVMHAQQAHVVHQTLDLSVKPGKVQSCSSEAENDSADSSKEGGPARNDSDASDDDDHDNDNDAWENRIANAQASSLALYGAGMYNNVAMPVVPFQSGIQNNPNAQLEASGRKRNRTFIDPVSEVPKLERWFSDVTTHPHHAQIEEFTAELNSMEYRQKFPKLEPRNVQFWFKNRRAKYKRIEKSANSTMETTVTS